MKTYLASGTVGFASTLLIALTGCTTYVQQPPQPSVYVPPPAPVYVQQSPPPEPAPAVVVIQREDDFYRPLSPYGEWVAVGGYGRCWRPARVEAGWRPYASGHWELTDAGWYWMSDEPWGWATYHYGRWVLTSDYGWIWIPQTQWAPAWVSWREGGGYVGWAPLPPEPRADVRINVTIAPATFVFVEERRMHEPVRPTTVIVNNTTIINKTVNITKTKIVNKNVVINEGPRADVVERESGRRIEKKPLSELRHRQEEPVAETHPDLKQPERRVESPAAVQDQRRNAQPHENRGQSRKAARQEQNPVPVTAEPESQPAARPPRAPRPMEDQGNRERLQRETTPPANPVPHEVNQPELKPAPRPPRAPRPVEDQGNRERLQRETPTPANPVPHEVNQQDLRPAPPQVEHPEELQPERRNGKPDKQKNEPVRQNEKNKKAKKQDGTNAVDDSKGEKR